MVEVNLFEWPQSTFYILNRLPYYLRYKWLNKKRKKLYETIRNNHKNKQVIQKWKWCETTSFEYICFGFVILTGVHIKETHEVQKGNLLSFSFLIRVWMYFRILWFKWQYITYWVLKVNNVVMLFFFFFSSYWWWDYWTLRYFILKLILIHIT